METDPQDKLPAPRLPEQRPDEQAEPPNSGTNNWTNDVELARELMVIADRLCIGALTAADRPTLVDIQAALSDRIDAYDIRDADPREPSPRIPAKQWPIVRALMAAEESLLKLEASPSTLKTEGQANSMELERTAA